MGAQPASSTWDFGELPETIELAAGAGRIVAYPALVDRGGSVDLVLAPTQQAARVLSAIGASRLVLLALPEQAKVAAKAVSKSLALRAGTLPPCPLPDALGGADRPDRRGARSRRRGGARGDPGAPDRGAGAPAARGAMVPRTAASSPRPSTRSAGASGRRRASWRSWRRACSRRAPRSSDGSPTLPPPRCGPTSSGNCAISSFAASSCSRRSAGCRACPTTCAVSSCDSTRPRTTPIATRAASPSSRRSGIVSSSRRAARSGGGRERPLDRLSVRARGVPPVALRAGGEDGDAGVGEAARGDVAAPGEGRASRSARLAPARTPRASRARTRRRPRSSRRGSRLPAAPPACSPSAADACGSTGAGSRESAPGSPTSLQACAGRGTRGAPSTCAARQPACRNRSPRSASSKYRKNPGRIPRPRPTRGGGPGRTPPCTSPSRPARAPRAATRRAPTLATRNDCAAAAPLRRRPRSSAPS